MAGRSRGMSTETSRSRVVSEGGMTKTATTKSRKSWRALDNSDTSDQVVTPLHMDIDMSKFAEGQQEENSKHLVKKVEVRRNVGFDPATGKASVLRDVRFKNRWYGQERVDDPTAEFDNMNFARAVASDLAQIFKAYPGDSQLVRLRKPMSPGAYTAEREAWMQSFAVNQGEKMKALLVEFGVPATSVKVAVEFAGPSAPGGMFYLQVPSQSFANNKKAKETQNIEQTKAVVAKKNVKFDFETGKCCCVKEIAWKSRYCGRDTMEAPTAEFADLDEAKRVVGDMAVVWQIWQAPATIFADVDDMGTGDPCMEEWYQQLGRNRALFMQRALEEHCVPRGQLEAMISGDRQDPHRRSRSADPNMLACTCSGPPSPEMRTPGLQAQKIRIKAKLQKAAFAHRVEDIPLLEECLAEARRMRLEEHWSRVDPLISDAENNLKVLYQRKRRQQAWALSKDRQNALAKVTVAKVTQDSMAACGYNVLPVSVF